ncbi:NAD(P)/FAD-dependent oxidoreductase [Dermacoccaceae bacterium W4C1]
MSGQSAGQSQEQSHEHRVVIVGSGFGGLFAARALRKVQGVRVTLISGTTHHLFQPLLYQVATGILSEGLIAPTTREVLAKQANAETVFGTVTDIDLASRTVTAKALDETHTYDYDSLIVAAGAGQSYFGNDQFARYAPGMKSIDDALELRGRIFGAFEMAELAGAAGHQDEVDKLMTFVVVGAGPTGVEMAGQINELSRRTLANDFRNIDPTKAKVILLDAAPGVLPAFGAELGSKAAKKLESMGVDVQLGAKVIDVDATGIEVEDPDGTKRRIPAICKVWAAGVSASPLGKIMADQSGAEVDRAGRVKVQDDLTLPGHPEVFLVGDMISLKNYPGVAQLAIQGGRYAARAIARRLKKQPSQGPFKYRDKGSMATISRFSAVASVGNLRFTGFLAWALWLGVHLVYIIGFKSRVTTMAHWAVAFVGRARGERTTTEQQVYARLALEELGSSFKPSLHMGEDKKKIEGGSSAAGN